MLPIPIKLWLFYRVLFRILHKESTCHRVPEGACYEIANADAGKIMSSTPGVLVSGT